MHNWKIEKKCIRNGWNLKVETEGNSHVCGSWTLTHTQRDRENEKECVKKNTHRHTSFHNHN